MSHIIKTIFLFTVAVIIFSACKKGDNQKLLDENESVTEIMSTKSGSWWLYGSNEGIVTRRVATGRDSFKLERTYNYYETTDTTTGHITPEYFGKNGNNYIMLVDLDGNETEYINVIVQKENPQTGDKWSNTAERKYSGIPFNIRTDGKIVSTGGTMTINGNTFTNVTEVENALKVKLAPELDIQYKDCGKVRMWFARGVGIIKSDFDISIKLAFIKAYSRHYADSLVAYHIEP